MPPPKNKRKQKLIKRTGLSRQRIEQIQKEGLDREGYWDARERKEKAVADLREEMASKARLERVALQESVISRDEVKKSTRMIADILKRQVDIFKAAAAPKLAGKDELGVRTALDAEIDSLIDGIHDGLEKLTRRDCVDALLRVPAITPEQAHRFRKNITAAIRADRDSR